MHIRPRTAATTGPGARQGAAGSRRNTLVLAAMVFAVAMMFIDQTIVAIAIPNIEKELSLSGAGGQWVVNGYLLALSALFAFGGKLADLLGRRLIVIVGVVGFAVTSALCGFSPSGAAAEAWIIGFRVGQGIFGALLFPAAVGIVVASFPIAERGRAMAIFFGITGAMTAIGPIAGGYLTAWTWRAIFWINVPVAVIALILIWISKPDEERHRGRLDYPGAVLISLAMGLIVLGLQQSSVWGWHAAATWACLAAGAVTAAAFVAWELRAPAPLLQLRIFADRGFAVDTVVLTTMSVVFVPFFCFASLYSQAALGTSASDTGLYLMWFFIGFVIAAQIGGRLLDRRGARLPVVVGAAIGPSGST